MPEVPFAVLWEIPENQLLPLKDSVNGHLESAFVSNFPGFQHRLRIYPNGNTDARRGQTWVFIYLTHRNLKKGEAEFNVTVESADCAKKCLSPDQESIQLGTIAWGYCFCKTEEFFDSGECFIYDGKLTVKCDGIFKVETDVVSEQQKWVGGELGDVLWGDNDTKDCTVVVDNKQIKESFFMVCRRR
uniref:MATH domain-containing protein n=1 Tax=Panagrolaimus davidi TaxID=227884 RepID=A0A914QMF5_9BILA